MQINVGSRQVSQRDPNSSGCRHTHYDDDESKQQQHENTVGDCWLAKTAKHQNLTHDDNLRLLWSRYTRATFDSQIILRFWVSSLVISQYQSFLKENTFIIKFLSIFGCSCYLSWFSVFLVFAHLSKSNWFPCTLRRKAWPQLPHCGIMKLIQFFREIHRALSPPTTHYREE